LENLGPEMNMEKLVVGFARSIVCASLLASLAACGGGGEESNSNPTGAGSSSSPSAVTSPSSNPSAPTSPSSDSSTPAPAEPVSTPPAVTPTPAPTAQVNAAPKITGTPSTQVTAGQSYSFTPKATDTDGDHLTFSIASKPSWATFNSTTGKMTGTPTANDVGSHEEIAISVSDGQHTASLAQFAINVEAPAATNVTLAWQAPTENTDGSTLTNLQGYKIHYGTKSGTYTQTVTLSNAGLTRYVVENLAPGTYFFAITAVTSAGAESDLSGEASKSI
jgi:hypothetical protein